MHGVVKSVIVTLVVMAIVSRVGMLKSVIAPA